MKNGTFAAQGPMGRRSGRVGIMAVAVGGAVAVVFPAVLAGPRLACGAVRKEVEVAMAEPPANAAPVLRAAGDPLGPPPEAGGSPVLDLHENGYSVGRLLDAPAVADGPRTTLLWKSDLFATPLELSIPEIVRIRFPRREAAAARPGSWRFELHGGDVIIGALEGIDGERFTVSPLDVGVPGPLQIRRALVARMRRLQEGARTIVPGTLEGWDAVRGVWQEQAGMLFSDRANALAYRDVGAPVRACYDMVLSWTVRPDFDLYVATDAEQFVRLKAPAPGKKPNDVEEYRLQATGGKVQAWREGAKADFDEIAPLDAGGGSLHVQVFVDQETGRMAVAVPKDGQPAEKPAFDKTVAPRKAVIRPGFSIKLRKGTVRIDSLRVVDWDGKQPRLEPVVGLGSRTAVIESFDKAAGEFVVRDGDETRRVAAAAAAEIEFPAPAGEKPAAGPAAVVLGFPAGSRLTGAVREIGGEKITLDSPALGEPLACPVDRVALLESAGPRRARSLPGRVGLIEGVNDRMLGCVVHADGVGWQASGAATPTRFAPTAAARIAFRGVPLLGGAGIAVARQGNILSVTEITPGGPAARDGRIQPGWKLETIQLLPGGQPLQTAGIKTEDVVALLRGIVGSSVGLRLTDATGQAQELTLVRDRAGRGEVKDTSEQELLEAAAKVHDEKSGIKATAGQKGSLITLKTGDAIFCEVVSGDSEGLRVKTDRGNEVLVPNVLLRAAELVNAPAMPISPQKMERLTTLPRMQVSDPPTHMIRLESGDYLRGRLLSLGKDTLKFKVLEETKDLPRPSLARIIWLTVAGDNANQKAVEMIAGGEGLPVQGISFDKRRLTVAADRMEDGMVIGTAGPLGRLPIDLRACESLLIGAAIASQPATNNSFKQWELKPAKPPAALLKK